MSYYEEPDRWDWDDEDEDDYYEDLEPEENEIEAISEAETAPPSNSSDPSGPGRPCGPLPRAVEAKAPLPEPARSAKLIHVNGYPNFYPKIAIFIRVNCKNVFDIRAGPPRFRPFLGRSRAMRQMGPEFA